MASRFGVSIPTAFDWRPKILLSLPEVSDKFEGEVYVDDLWIRYSQKGRRGIKYPNKRGGTSHKGDNNYQVKILTAENSLQTEMKVTNIGRIKSSDIQRSLSNKLSKNVTMTSDKHQSLKMFSKANKIHHIDFKAEDHTTSESKGVQRLNNIAS